MYYIAGRWTPIVLVNGVRKDKQNYNIIKNDWSIKVKLCARHFLIIKQIWYEWKRIDRLYLVLSHNAGVSRTIV